LRFAGFILFSIIIGEVPIVSNKLSKLMPKQHLLNIIIYMKHDEITRCMMPSCGISQKKICDDALFIASNINHMFTNLMAHIEGWGYVGYTFAMNCLGVLDSLMAP
jgi:hypothetical protein